MPYLKFRCKRCGKVFDELTTLSRIDEVKCPDCKAEVERAYEGKCQCPKGGGGSCSGSCASCGGCH